VEKEKVVQKEVTKIVQQEVTKVVQQEVTKVVQATKQPVTLRLHYRAGGETSEIPIYITRPKEFTAETGIQVKLEPIPGGEYWAKVETLAAGGTLGDNMFTTEQGWYHSRMVHFGILAPIDDYMAAQKVSRDEWLPAVIGTCTFGGKTYGLPKCAHPGFAYIRINHTLFQEAGIPIPPVQGVTWDQVMDWGIKLSKGPKEKRDQYGFFVAKDGFQQVINGLHSWGGWEIEENRTSVKADGDPWKLWVRWNHRALVQDRISPLASELGTAGVVGLFAAGKLAMFHGDRSQQRQVLEAVGPMEGGGKFKWSAIAMPVTPAFTKHGLSLNTHAGTMQSQNKLESFKLAYALADKRFAELVANEQGYLVGRTKEMDEIGKAKDDPFIKLQYEEGTKGVPYRIGKNLRGTEYDTTLRNSLDPVYLGKTEPDDAFFKQWNTALNAVLQKPVP
jgi:ABC-type glycerol-3-phosphate transport system substrate-binding protein